MSRQSADGDSRTLPLPTATTYHLKNWPIASVRGICSSSIPTLYSVSWGSLADSKCYEFNGIQRNGANGDNDTSKASIDLLIPDYESLKWNVNILAAAFSLPLDVDEDFDIVSTTISLLSLWLSEPQEFLESHVVNGRSVSQDNSYRLPLKCLNEDNKYDFFLLLIKATSLLFVPRDNKKLTLAQKKKHFRACCRTLKLLMRSVPIILSVTDLKNKDLTCRTQGIYEVVLRQLLGINQELLSIKNAMKMFRGSASTTISTAESHPYLSRRLAPFLLRAFFEILLVGMPIFFSNSIIENGVFVDTGTKIINDVLSCYVMQSAELWLIGGASSMYVYYCVLKTVTTFVVANKLWNKKHINGDRLNCSEEIDNATHVLKIDWLLHGDDASGVLKTYVASEVFSIFKLWNRKTFISVRTNDSGINNDLVYFVWINLIKTLPNPGIFVNGLSSTNEMLFNIRHKSLGSRYNKLTAMNSSLDFASAVDVVGQFMLMLLDCPNSFNNFNKPHTNFLNTAWQLNTVDVVTVLDSFGMFLYQNTTAVVGSETSAMLYKEGVIKCIKVLCTIFDRVCISNYRSNWKHMNASAEQHVVHFYSILTQLLQIKTDIDILKATLVYGRIAIVQNIPESRVLIEKFIDGINTVLHNDKKSIWNEIPSSQTTEQTNGRKSYEQDLSNERVRHSVLIIISNLIGRSRNFRGPSACSDKGKLKIFEVIRKNTGRILLSFLSKETSTYNLQLAFSILSRKLYEDRKVPGIAQVTISTILSKYFLDNEWNELLKRDAVELLRSISIIVNDIHVTATHTIPNMLSKFCDDVLERLEAISSDIELAVFTDTNSTSSFMEQISVKKVEISSLLIIDINNMLSKYVQQAPWLIKTHNIGDKIVTVATNCCGIGDIFEAKKFLGKSTLYFSNFKIVLERLERSGSALLGYLCHDVGKIQSKSAYNDNVDSAVELASFSYYSIGNRTILSVPNGSREIHKSNGQLLNQVTLRTSSGRVEWEGIPSQIQSKQSVGCNDDKIQGIASSRQMDKYRNIVPSAHRLLLAPEQMEMVTFAENLLKQALRDETLATLSKDDIKAKVLPHFNDDGGLYDVCQESIDNLFQKYVSLISRDEQKKTLGKINEGSDDTCQALMKESKASQEACDKIEGDNHLPSNDINTDKHQVNLFIASTDMSFSDDPVAKMFNILNSSRDTVSRGSDKDVNNLDMGDTSVRKVALFRCPKSSSNLCICSSTDYVVSEDNTAYAKIHKNHLARTHKIFNNSIASEKKFYVNGLRPTSNVIHRCKEAVEAKGEAATSESKNALVQHFSGNRQVGTIGLNRWLLLQLGIISDCIAGDVVPSGIVPLCNSDNPLFIENIRALDMTTVHTDVTINLSFVTTKDLLLGNSENGLKSEFAYTDILANEEAIVHVAEKNPSKIKMFYKLIKHLGKAVNIGEYDHLIGHQQMYLSEGDKVFDIVNTFDHGNTECMYKLCYKVPFWEILLKAHLIKEDSMNCDHGTTSKVSEGNNCRSDKDKAVKFFERNRTDKINKGSFGNTVDHRDSLSSGESVNTYVHVDVVINDTEMFQIAQSEPEKNGTKDNESFQSKVFQKYVLRQSQDNIQKEDCIMIVIIPLEYDVNISIESTILCKVLVHVNNAFRDKCKYINEMYYSDYNKDNNGSQGNLAFIGPLTSNSIYPIDELPRLLQETIVNANNIFNRYMLFDPEGKFKTDLYRRRDMIEDIINGKNVLHRKESKIRRLVDLPRELGISKYIPRVPKEEIGRVKYLF